MKLLDLDLYQDLSEARAELALITQSIAPHYELSLSEEAVYGLVLALGRVESRIAAALKGMNDEEEKPTC